MPFTKGKSGNPGGRPAHQAKYLKSLVRLVKSDDWRKIVEKAIMQAKNGDKTARQWLADYIVGKPIQAMDVTSNGETIHAVGFDADKV
jgi:hypothetical protein